MMSFRGYNATDGYSLYNFLISGEDMRVGTVLKSPNMQLALRHIPSQASKFSYVTAERSPLVGADQNIYSTTAGGNTITISGYDFATDELTGAYINIYNSSNNLVETQTITSNTATQITITGTWIASTSNAYFKIYVPVFLGETTTVFRRLYVEEGSSTGGIRFGVGPTSTSAGGQNGLLYMDSAGDLYWRPKATAVAVKLN